MFAEGIAEFLGIWLVVLGATYLLAGRFIGLTLFFAATTTLYVILPSYFFPNDAVLFDRLIATVVLGVLGFYVGLTCLSGFSERRLMGWTPPSIDLFQVGRAALVLLVVSLVLLFLWRPGFVAELGTYEGRINFAGAHGPLVFLLNQVVICAAILIVWAYHRRHFGLVLLITGAEFFWAVYSSAKISILAAAAAWLAIALFSNWKLRISNRRLLTAIAVLFPSSLVLMVAYAVLRSGVGDLDTTLAVISHNLERLGAGGAHVGDYGGPYFVFTEHLRDPFLGMSMGMTYLEQLQVLIPRIVRGEFMDLAEAFSQEKHGSNFVPGLGFGYSPWAEGYLNFRVPGFFVEGLLFGVFSALLFRASTRAMGFNELVIFFQILLIPVFQRYFLAGQIKATVVYCLPFLVVYVALNLLLRRTDRLPLLLRPDATVTEESAESDAAGPADPADLAPDTPGVRSG